MYSIEKLPDGYISLNKLNVCSNVLIGGGFIFSLGTILPLIIGKGPVPMIWMQSYDFKSKKSNILVDGNISRHPDVLVTKPEDGVVEIGIIKGVRMLRVKNTGGDSSVVSFMDLRPIGLNITGDQNELKVGNSSFSKNTIEGVNVFFGLGD